MADRSLTLIQVLRMRGSIEISPSVSQQRSSFDRKAVHVKFLVANVTSGQVFLKLLLCTMPFIVLLIILVHIHSSTIEPDYFSIFQMVQNFSGSHLAYSMGIQSSSPECEVV
jgi:hypothetical protein